MDDPTPTKRPCVHPSPEMVRWIELAATYQRAGLGNTITPQTEQALQEMVTFLTQPAQVYGTEQAGSTPPPITPIPQQGEVRRG
jgi:hypothetical protein